MITETSGKNELLTAINEKVSQLQGLISTLDKDEVNAIPFKDSWTAGQLLWHVTKSISGMAQALGMDAEPATRDASERISELKKVFLDFSNKLKSPDFIAPEPRQYDKQKAVDDLNKSFELLKENANNANLTDMVENLPLGPITKLEMLHFVLYHTQRHLHQMEKISDALKN